MARFPVRVVNGFSCGGRLAAEAAARYDSFMVTGDGTEADYTAAVRSLLGADAERVLCIGPECAGLFGPWAAERPTRRLHCLTPDAPLEALTTLGRFDFAYVSGTLEFQPRSAALHLLARLRDLHAGRVAVLVPLGAWPGLATRWQETDLLALGFTLIARFDHGGRRLGLFGFDIARYKTTPDWLNPRFWANPGNWDRYWW